MGVIYWDGYIFDLIIIWVSEDGFVLNCCVGDCIFDYFVVYCDL